MRLRCTGHYCGSSPRAWGIQFQAPVHGRSTTVHPHGRGEYSTFHAGSAQGDGSSPRAWGIRRHHFGAVGQKPVHPHGRGEYFDRKPYNCAGKRFIPTGVGNTFFRVFARNTDNGSSPRAWGIRKQGALEHRANSVHPHGRGEYAI